VILVDTSLWVDYLRHGLSTLAQLLQDGRVLGHPWVVGELGLGHLSQREEILPLLGGLPQAVVATHDEVMGLVDRHRLFGLGIGYVDAQLLAGTLLTGDAALWTADRRLHRVATRLGCAATPEVEEGYLGSLRQDWAE